MIILGIVGFGLGIFIVLAYDYRLSRLEESVNGMLERNKFEEDDSGKC